MSSFRFLIREKVCFYNEKYVIQIQADHLTSDERKSKQMDIGSSPVILLLLFFLIREKVCLYYSK